MCLAALLTAWTTHAATSTCSFSVTQGSFSLDLSVEPSTFGPHVPLQPQSAAPVAVRLVPEGCLRGCVAVDGNACATILQGARNAWAVVQRSGGGVQCDAGAPLFGSGVLDVVGAQQVGAIGVLLIEESTGVTADSGSASSSAVSIPSMWATAADAASLLSRNDFSSLQAVPSCDAPELPRDGTVLHYSAAAYRTLYFTFTHSFSDGAEAFSIVATPTFGSPRAFLGHGIGSDTALVALPHPGGLLIAKSEEGAPPAVHMAIAAPGVYLVALVSGETASDGTMRLERGWLDATGQQPSPQLLDGEPHRLTIAAHGWQKLQLETVVPSHSVRLHTAVLAGQGKMYMCINDPAQVSHANRA